MGELLEAAKIVLIFALIGVLTIGVGVQQLSPAEMAGQNARGVAASVLASPNMIVVPMNGVAPEHSTAPMPATPQLQKNMSRPLPADPQEMLEYLRDLNVIEARKQTPQPTYAQQLSENVIASSGANNMAVIQKKLRTFLNGSELEGLEAAICSASLKYSVDPYFIVAVAVHESNWGKSRIAHEKKNLFGLNAVDADPYNQAFSFPTKEDSVFFFAQLISLQYSNMTIENVGRMYATDANWAYAVITFMNQAKSA